MKKGWETVDLNRLATISYGYTQSAASTAIGPKFLRITDIQNDALNWSEVPYCKMPHADFARYGLQSHDIVFARTGSTTGKSFFIEDPPEAVFASYLIRVRVQSPAIVPKFLAMFFQTPWYWSVIRGGTAGSAQGGFNATKLGAIQIPIPPLPEQRRIVGILDEAFAGLATAEANAARNLQNAREIFDSHLHAVFSQRGEGWVERRVSALASHSLGKMLDKSKNKGEPQKYLRNLNVRWFEFNVADLAEMKFMPNESEKYSVRKGDVLICEGGYPGRSAVWESEDSMYFQKALHRVRFHEPLHDWWFVYYLYVLDCSGVLLGFLWLKFSWF